MYTEADWDSDFETTKRGVGASIRRDIQASKRRVFCTAAVANIWLSTVKGPRKRVLSIPDSFASATIGWFIKWSF